MDRDVLLVRYETMAANRRHFDILFFAVTAFSYLFSLALWAAIVALKPAAGTAALVGAGAILLGGAFIAHRLQLRERSAFEAMASSWRDIAGIPAEQRRLRPGAMSVAAAGQGLIGLLCIAAAALRLD